MGIRKIIRKTVPYDIRFLLNPLRKHLLHKSFRIRAAYTKAWETTPVIDNMIFYEAYHGRSMTGNPFAIFTYLLEDPSFRDYQHIWAISDLSKIPNQYRNLKNVTFVSYHSQEYARYLATAKYLINDTSFPAYFQKRKDQIYTNTWHGTPLKTLGMDIKNRGVTDHKNIQRNFLFADFIVSPNKYTAEKLLKSHDVNSIYGGKILDTGYPRVDLMYKANKKELKRILAVPENKKIILYAPTWRGKLGKEEDQSKRIQKDVKKIQENIGSDYLVLVKSHYYATKFFKEQGLEHLCVPDRIDTNELLSVVDVLITDYSSIFFEFLPTKKPILFYAYDAEDYQRERGTYMEMDELPGPLCMSVNQVIDCIQDLDRVTNKYNDVYHSFLNTFCYHDNGQSTARLVDTIFHGKVSEDLFSVETNKTKILIYGGGFLNNGITSSLISLLNSIDYEKYDVTLIDHGTNTKKMKWNNMEKVNNNVHHIFRLGTWNASLIDMYRHTLFFYTGMQKLAPIKMYKREYERMVGNTNFDIGIDFGGYSPFWASIFAFGHFKRRSIYLHSDMEKELHKVVNNKYPHRRNLKVIFSLYTLFDKVLSVSKLTHEQNWKNLKTFITDYEKKMDYVINAIDYKKILNLKGDRSEFQYEFGEEIGPESALHRESTSDYPMPKATDYNFITIGRLSPEKDHHKLIESFSLVSANNSNVKLYIVGDGALKDHLIQHVKTKNLHDKVFFTGHLDNPYNLLDQCDCFVLSSNYEGQAIVLLEALVLGKPTISTDIPGPRSVIEDGYGLIVENSVSGLANGMSQCLNGNYVPNNRFDYEAYHNEALNMFYDKVCNIED
ncbi:CDP-glycerol glycerophosphotransferase [Oceanobacillus limi]|uniref:CDP-glycerol glycerophosphotransferase n=1 Tax=Oceanobacillus limi TaxID=930131 RepID=A0A1I0A4X8_9BACI|nr:glycosyltransferase [Oceanobacillus limi]SES88747.1 CDP-glycerol glycerophosphotransferase [Oceanobacillus limi]